MDDFGDMEIERYISKLYISRIQKKRGIKANLSVSMPLDLKTDFLLAASYNNEDYKDLFQGWIKSYLQEKGIDVLVSKKTAMIVEEQLELEELKAMIQEKGSARIKVSTGFIHERILKLIKIPLARGEWTIRDDPVDVSDVEIIVRDAVKKYGITWEDACRIINARAEKIDNHTLRKSFDFAISEILTRLPGEGMRPVESPARTNGQPGQQVPAAGDQDGLTTQRVNFGKRVNGYEV